MNNSQIAILDDNSLSRMEYEEIDKIIRNILAQYKTILNANDENYEIKSYLKKLLEKNITNVQIEKKDNNNNIQKDEYELILKDYNNILNMLNYIYPTTYKKKYSKYKLKYISLKKSLSTR